MLEIPLAVPAIRSSHASAKTSRPLGPGECRILPSALIVAVLLASACCLSLMMCRQSSSFPSSPQGHSHYQEIYRKGTTEWIAVTAAEVNISVSWLRCGPGRQHAELTWKPRVPTVYIGSWYEAKLIDYLYIKLGPERRQAQSSACESRAARACFHGRDDGDSYVAW